MAYTKFITMFKGVGEVLDYQINWGDVAEVPPGEYLGTGETISSSSWAVTTGITVVSDSNTPTKTTVWLSGGTLGETYTVTNTITTSAVRTVERAFFVNLTTR